MSWSNPSPDEASEKYYYYKNRYNNAANQKNSYYRQECNYVNERNSLSGRINSASTEKIQFEKRLAGIENIIRTLESGSVPQAILKANKAIACADESMSKSIRLIGGGQSCNLQEAFITKTVDEDSHTSTALAVYKSECQRIEEELRKLSQTISSLTDQVNSLNTQIRNCDEMQASLRRTMNESVYEMNHYKKYMD